MKVKVIITTAAPDTVPAWSRDTNYGKKKDDAYYRRSAYLDVFGDFGAYTHIEVTNTAPTTVGGEFYNSGLVPAHDPKWSSSTYQDILVHELIGHGMNNEDEVDRKAERNRRGVVVIPPLNNRTSLRIDWGSGLRQMRL